MIGHMTTGDPIVGDFKTKYTKEEKQKAWLKAKSNSQVASTRKDEVSGTTTGLALAKVQPEIQRPVNTHKRKSKRRTKII